MRSLLLVLSATVVGPTAFARDLHSVVSENIKKYAAPEEVSAPYVAPQELGYIPFQSFEYRIGTSDEDDIGLGRRALGVPRHSLRFNMKSVEEFIRSNEGVNTSRELLKTDKMATTNLNLYGVYQGIVQNIFTIRLNEVLGKRQGQLEALIEKSSLTLGLSKINTKSLVDNLDQQGKVERELGLSQAQPVNEIPELNINETLNQMLKNIKPLQAKVLELQNQTPLEIKAKRLEARLERFHDEIKWADDEKFVSFFEIKQDLDQRETEYQVAFNIPWLRFDGLNKNREKALLHIKERALERETRELQEDMRVRTIELQGLAAQVDSLNSRLQKTRGIESKIKSLSDMELKSVLGEFAFETELNLLLLGREFYLVYLEYLKDLGTFAAEADADLLDPQWRSLKM